MEIIKALLLEKYDKGQQIFDYGDRGDKFYIVLEGSVIVSIPFLINVRPDETERRKQQVVVEK